MLLSKKKQKDINLIPEAEKPLRAAKAKLVTIVAVPILIGIFILVGVVFVGLSFSEENKAKGLSAELDDKLSQWQQVAEVATKAGAVKAKSAQLGDVRDSNQNLATSLDKIRKNVPSAVKFESLSVKSTNALTVQATSTSPAQIHQFVDRLKSEQDFFEKVRIASLVKTSDGYILNLDLTIK
ncbi:MAG TPA: PilN domain-containing protein [Candidatus Nanoarchaeia archaeon]